MRRGKLIWIFLFFFTCKVKGQDIIAKFDKGRPQTIKMGSLKLQYGKGNRLQNIVHDSMIEYNYSEQTLSFGNIDKITIYKSENLWHIKFKDSIIKLDTNFGRTIANSRVISEIDEVITSNTVTFRDYSVSYSFFRLINDSWEFKSLELKARNPYFSNSIYIDFPINQMGNILIMDYLIKNKTSIKYYIDQFRGKLLDVSYHKMIYNSNNDSVYKDTYYLGHYRKSTRPYLNLSYWHYGLSKVKDINNYIVDEPHYIDYVFEFNRFGRLRYRYRKRFKDLDIFTYTPPNITDVLKTE